MAGVIEVAAMNQKLSYLGHEAAKEFDEKLIKTLQQRRVHRAVPSST
jgi:serine kinase of HPr protein (carbohydrate metabolism regulator)